MQFIEIAFVGEINVPHKLQVIWFVKTTSHDGGSFTVVVTTPKHERTASFAKGPRRIIRRFKPSDVVIADHSQIIRSTTGGRHIGAGLNTALRAVACHHSAQRAFGLKLHFAAQTSAFVNLPNRKLLPKRNRPALWRACSKSQMRIFDLLVHSHFRTFVLVVLLQALGNQE